MDEIARSNRLEIVAPSIILHVRRRTLTGIIRFPGYHYLPPIQHPSYQNLEYGYYGNMGYFGQINKMKQQMQHISHNDINEIGHDWWER